MGVCGECFCKAEDEEEEEEGLLIPFRIFLIRVLEWCCFVVVVVAAAAAAVAAVVAIELHSSKNT